jgi:hypothetical protein
MGRTYPDYESKPGASLTIVQHHRCLLLQSIGKRREKPLPYLRVVNMSRLVGMPYLDFSPSLRLHDHSARYLRGIFVALTRCNALTSIELNPLFAFSKTWFCPES